MQRADPAQPFLGDFGLDGVGQKLETFEDVGKDLVEAIEVALVFHERRPREIVEILDAIADDVGADSLKQRQVLFQRHRHFGRAKLGEERLEHARKLGALTSWNNGPSAAIGAGTQRSRPRAASRISVFTTGDQKLIRAPIPTYWKSS